MSAAYMIQAQGGAVLLTWLVSHKGFGLYVTATVVSIATVAFLEWRDRAAPAQIDDASG